MPIYEYYCGKCDKVIEAMQKFSDPPLEKCSTCGASIEKLISQTSFHLKGSGWYATDYKKSSSSPAVSKPTASPATPEAKPTTGKGDGSGSNKPGP